LIDHWPPAIGHFGIDDRQGWDWTQRSSGEDWTEGKGLETSFDWNQKFGEKSRRLEVYLIGDLDYCPAGSPSLPCSSRSGLVLDRS
jgi:hypothetical protein